MRRHLGLIALTGLTGLLTGASIPARADTTPTGGINQCLVLAVCVQLSQSGSSGSPGSGAGNGSSSGGGGSDPVCTWQGIQKPCWDPDLGYFVTDGPDQGCYYLALGPSDPAWKEKDAHPGQDPYLTSCWDANGNPIDSKTTWHDKPPTVAAPPPDPGVVAQMAIKKLQFMRPVIHTAPTGSSLVTVPVFLWYDHDDSNAPETVGPQSATVDLNDISVTATATLTDVRWDIGYQAHGKEAVADCHGPGVPYTTGMESNPPAGACFWRFDSLSPANGAPPTSAPSPAASPSPGGGYWPVATEAWTITTVNNKDHTKPWPDLVFEVSSQPVQLQVNQLQVLN